MLLKKSFILSVGLLSFAAIGADLKLRFEVYEVSKEDYKADRNLTVELVKAGKAKLVVGAELTTPSGTRAKTESTKEVIYVADGSDAGVSLETRNVGTVIEAEPELAADGYTVALAYALENVTAAPEAEWRKIPAGGGVFLEDPKFATRKIVSSANFFAGEQWNNLGVMPDLVSEPAQSSNKVYPVFVNVVKVQQ